MCHKETKEILNANDLLALMETDLDYKQWISDVQRYPCRAWMVPY